VQSTTCMMDVPTLHRRCNNGTRSHTSLAGSSRVSSTGGGPPPHSSPPTNSASSKYVASSCTNMDGTVSTPKLRRKERCCCWSFASSCGHTSSDASRTKDQPSCLSSRFRASERKFNRAEPGSNDMGLTTSTATRWVGNAKSTYTPGLTRWLGSQQHQQSTWTPHTTHHTPSTQQQMDGTGGDPHPVTKRNNQRV